MEFRQGRGHRLVQRLYTSRRAPPAIHRIRLRLFTGSNEIETGSRARRLSSRPRRIRLSVGMRRRGQHRGRHQRMLDRRLEVRVGGDGQHRRASPADASARRKCRR